MIAIEKINPLLPILSQYVIAVIIAFVFNLVMSIQHGKKFEVSSPVEFYLGLLTCLTMSSSNYALSYVDYPTQALVKSSKILPVLAFGWVRKTYNYKLYKYVCAILITVGLIVFNLAKMGSKIQGMAVNAIGMFLLFVSLFFDGLLATQTDIEKSKDNSSNPFKLMFSSNLVGLILYVSLASFTYFYSHENVFDELNANNIKGILLIAVAGSLGQCFIFIMINRFNCFILSVVNTTRKFFNILFSIIWFNHQLNYLHWAGIIMVLGAITADVIISHKEKSKKSSEKEKTS